MKFLLKNLKEYCITVYAEPMAITIFMFVMASAITMSIGGIVRDGVIHWIYLMASPAILISMFLPMYLMGRRWTKIDKK